MVAPLNNTHASYRLHHASKSKRLFTKNDLNSLATLVHLTELSVGVAHARDHGAKLERERLARDIHDDLSAKLLTLLHKCSEHNRPIIQDTLNDLRNFLNQLEVEEILLEDALSEWRLENSMRFEPLILILSGIQIFPLRQMSVWFLTNTVTCDEFYARL